MKRFILLIQNRVDSLTSYSKHNHNLADNKRKISVEQRHFSDKITELFSFTYLFYCFLLLNYIQSFKARNQIFVTLFNKILEQHVDISSLHNVLIVNVCFTD